MPKPQAKNTSFDLERALLEAAYRDYADAIFRHIYFRILRRGRAIELLQEVFLKALQFLRKGHQAEDMKAFLFRIAFDLATDEIKRTKMPTSQQSSIEESKKSSEEKQVITALRKLNADDRELIVLRCIDGRKPKEIGEALGLSPNVISVRLHRAMKDLRSVLREP